MKRWVYFAAVLLLASVAFFFAYSSVTTTPKYYIQLFDRNVSVHVPAPYASMSVYSFNYNDNNVPDFILYRLTNDNGNVTLHYCLVIDNNVQPCRSATLYNVGNRIIHLDGFAAAGHYAYVYFSYSHTVGNTTYYAKYGYTVNLSAATSSRFLYRLYSSPSYYDYYVRYIGTFYYRGSPVVVFRVYHFSQQYTVYGNVYSAHYKSDDTYQVFENGRLVLSKSVTTEDVTYNSYYATNNGYVMYPAGIVLASPTRLYVFYDRVNYSGKTSTSSYVYYTVTSSSVSGPTTVMESGVSYSHYSILAFPPDGNYPIGAGYISIPDMSFTQDRSVQQVHYFPRYVSFYSRPVVSINGRGYLFTEVNGVFKTVAVPFAMPPCDYEYNGICYHVSAASFDSNTLKYTYAAYARPPVVAGFDLNVLGTLDIDHNVTSVPVSLSVHPLGDVNVTGTLSLYLGGNFVSSMPVTPFRPFDVNVPVTTGGHHTLTAVIADSNVVVQTTELNFFVRSHPYDLAVYALVPSEHNVFLAAVARDFDVNTPALHYQWTYSVTYSDGTVRDFNGPSSPTLHVSGDSIVLVHACVTVTNDLNLSDSACADVNALSPTLSTPILVKGPPTVVVRKYSIPVEVLPYFYQRAGLKVSMPPAPRELSVISTGPVAYAVGIAAVLVIVALLLFA